MYGRLRRVAVRTPTLVGDFAGAGWRATPDSAILDEHAAFVAKLEELGCQVDVLDAVEGQVDSVFTYDPVFVTSKGGVVLNQIKPARVPEPPVLAADLEALGLPIIGRFAADAYADGGDMAWLDRDTLIIGRGFRTNARAIETMREILAAEGIDVVVYDTASGLGRDYVIHLMSYFSAIDEKKAVVHLPSLPVAMFELLEERGWTLIPCTDEEYVDGQGCNVLAVAPSVVVIYDSAPQTARAMREAGVEVHEVHAPNITLGDGGPTCITRPLLRD